MRLIGAAIVLGGLMAVSPLTAAAADRTAMTNRRDAMVRMLGTPQGGDDFLFRGAFQHNAQDLSNRLFGALEKVLGGKAPTLNFVPDVGSTDFHASATPKTNTINLDPYVTEGLVNEESSFHDSSVNAMPHEMMHLRQTPEVLAMLAAREGGAQAFANIVSPSAAALAHTRYAAGNFDGAYSDYVKQAQARGRDWIFGGQMGKPPVAWP